MSQTEIDNLIELLARLPGIGPRSARRLALSMLKKPDSLMRPLSKSLIDTANSIIKCSICGNLDTVSPCSICQNESRDKSIIVVIEEVADLWALERASVHKGLYHVLGGTLSAIDGVSPNDIGISELVERAQKDETKEIILAMNATIDGQTTAYYITDQLAKSEVKVSRLARGVPVGGELDYMDDGTLLEAIESRQPF
ncbi:MAG: recombination mediator RecR [Pseudomonadota bacterium]|jgi:recombination protein RecR|nr:recombination protein RecR [Rhodobiaceae bacterium]MDP6879129.1 recombination mediator RecR [Candidatus Neomarinimicrobiota bacterium]MEC9098147.1 recombination mediator RecR [Pseudomonadota bacterium]MQG19648.1 recombination protein RecR [SAR202 cluster bacterium]MED5253854.1 recombination mediator RecR [Pseudomonadota bacterium]